jgi:hypothetical protein
MFAQIIIIVTTTTTTSITTTVLLLLSLLLFKKIFSGPSYLLQGELWVGGKQGVSGDAGNKSDHQNNISFKMTRVLLPMNEGR